MARRIIVLRQEVAQRNEGGIVYLECMKNYATHIGRYAVDGCGEFMASAASQEYPEAELTCAACGYHRDYHRMEAVEDN